MPTRAKQHFLRYLLLNPINFVIQSYFIKSALLFISVLNCQI